jgi:succinate dehydrogenase/fumarate reductase-like Fe-S protein
MDLERTFILSNVINKLEKIQSNYNTNLCNTNSCNINSCNTNSCNINSEIYAALKEEIKTLQKEENKTFINDVCNFLVLPVTNSNGLKGQLYNLLLNKYLYLYLI